MWDREADVLATRHHVVRYDQRGFGRSPDTAADYFAHADLLSVMDATGVGRAVLVGASNGGRAVLDAAVSAPERVVGLVLVGSILPGAPSSADLDAVFEDEETALRVGDIARAREINLRLWVDGVGRDAGLASTAVRRSVGTWLDALLPRQATQLLTAAGQARTLDPPTADRLGQIIAPALIVVGQHDQPSMRMTALRLAFGIHRSRLVVVEHAAHLVNLEQPQQFDDALGAFLDDVSGTPAGA
ncbi:MAG TPA: alpha/beta hydrolase, partial [Euzebyales bacterium]|nr:alpha/beta hydrolase [Euzebyales bacterium]